MTWKLFFIKLAGLAVFTAMGFVLYAITSHFLILAGMMPTGEGSEGFGEAMTRQAMYLFMASIPIGFAGIFVKENWRWVLCLCPLYAPSVFAIIHTVTHN
jgi:hypothetical protein